MNFYSVSSDGRVVNWKLVKNELQCQDAVLLKIPGASVDGPEGTQQQALSELDIHSQGFFYMCRANRGNSPPPFHGYLLPFRVCMLHIHT
jgi:hypothetical protein